MLTAANTIATRVSGIIDSCTAREIYSPSGARPQQQKFTLLPFQISWLTRPPDKRPRRVLQRHPELLQKLPNSLRPGSERVDRRGSPKMPVPLLYSSNRPPLV